MSFTASARRIGDSLRHEVDVNGRHTIITDEPSSLGGTDQVTRLRRVAATCPLRRALESDVSFDEHLRFPALAA